MFSDATPLRRARMMATMVLAIATAIFVSTFFMGDATWVGFVRAAAEAGMIGGLADWFAVVALFRHPLGVPIPHTAIIPKSKDALGHNLAGFITDNFLDPVTIRDRLVEAELPAKLGAWLAEDEGAKAAAGHLSIVLGAVGEGTASDQVWADLETLLLDRVRRMPVASLIGRALERSLDSGEIQPLMTGAITAVDRSLTDNAAYLRRKIAEESPWWVPESLDDVVFEKAMEIAHRFLTEVAANPSHPVRGMVDARLAELANRLQSDPELQADVAARVIAITERPEFRDWLRSAWSQSIRSLTEASDQLTSTLKTLGTRLSEDTELQARIASWLEGMAEPMTEAARTELQTLIPATVARWDPEDTAARLEQWMGRDLQFVRINGTLVGSLIGLVLHTVVVLFE
jgi:uncharacterized membrane-anchored protein YjiN (DUF445 family)